MRTLTLFSLFVVLTGCRSNAPEQRRTTEHRRAPDLSPSAKARVEAGSLPDSKLTPGATLDVTKDDICTPGYSKKVRNVPESVKKQVFKEYNTTDTPGEYEVDHLISLELGGSNNIRNLWPESYDIYWNAHVKDGIENRLHSMVCEGTISMQEAQKEISTDWIDAYKKYFHTDIPLEGQSKRERNHSDRKAFR